MAEVRATVWLLKDGRLAGPMPSLEPPRGLVFEVDRRALDLPFPARVAEGERALGRCEGFIAEAAKAWPLVFPFPSV